MRIVSNYLFLLGLVVTSSVAARDSEPYQIEGLYRAPNINGMTGLLTMNTPHTMGTGMTAIAGATLANDLPGQYTSLIEAVGALRVGLSNNVEIGLKAKTYNVKPTAGGSLTGLGDSEAMVKWKFREQNDNLMAMALGLGVILPTGSKDKGFREVESIGMKLSVSGAGENQIYDDGYIGLYFEGQVVAIDTIKNSSPYKDMYGVVNIGLAFPISDDNHLSVFVEFNNVLNKDVVTMEREHSTVSPGLRYAHKNFSMTMAAQMVDYGNTGTQTRLMGLASLGF